MSGRLRASVAFAFLLLLAAGWRFGRAATGESARYRSVLNFARGISQANGLFSTGEQSTLVDLTFRFQSFLNLWTAAPDNQAVIDTDRAMGRLIDFFEASPEFERLWSAAASRPIVRTWPTGSGTVLLRIGCSGVDDPGPRFVEARYDLSNQSEVDLALPPAGTVYAALHFSNAPSGTKHVPIHLGSIAADLAVTTPPTGELKVQIVDDAGQLTPAAAAVYASNGELMVPVEDAISFDEGGFSYQSGRVRPHLQARYWPGDLHHAAAFFVDGGFTLRLPAGTYRLLASKGPEYRPVDESVTVAAGSPAKQDLKLHRWIDMPARGWYSGDGHVHYTRSNPEAARRLGIWARAEDIHLANVLRMGDASETYFEQYAFGNDGRYQSGDYAQVPGQEDPRTNIIGHTMQLNLKHAIHMADRYYFYDQVFDETHRQGGLTGYAHIYQPHGAAFFVRRDMAMNVPAGRVDFAEICEFGDIGEDLYYEFLNLGFPLTASAGSDVPWGNTIGTSRVYAYTGDRFSPDAWFAALKAGHTFVTTGAMLEFTVNGRIAGSTLAAKPGDVLHIKAAASGGPVDPRYLEIVAQGDVIRSSRQLKLEFDLPVTRGTWIAARCSGAHTTPVYVKVNGERFWKRDAVPQLVAHRLAALQEIDDLTRQQIQPSHRGNWDSPAVWKASAAGIRERIQIARQVYARLVEEARK
jgi:hypothetical protein